MNLIATAPAWAETAGTVILSSAGASVLYWLSKRRGVDAPESFKPEKAGITLGVAFVLSVVLYVTGQATGIDSLLANLSVFVGPVALYAQKVVDKYQRTGRIDLSNASVDDAANALADSLGVSVDDVLRFTGSLPEAATGTETGSPADHSAAKTMESVGYTPSNPDASATPSESADTDTRIETAGYQDLRAVAAAVGVTPGQHPTIEGLRSALRSTDSSRVSEEFDAIERDNQQQ